VDPTAIVLAAGEGKRMHSRLPKVLHTLADRPMIAYPVAAALRAGARRVVVVVSLTADAIRDELRTRFGDRVSFVVQPVPRGTGDAVRRCASSIPRSGTILVLYGDTPLVEAPILRRLSALRARRRLALALLTSEPPRPAGYGRIVRDERRRIVAVREEKDCSAAERRIREVNPGFYAFDSGFLREALSSLRPDNAQGELYLTDVVARAARTGRIASVSSPAGPLLGVNDREQLAEAETVLRDRIRRAWMLRGVSMRDPRATYIGADVALSEDVTLDAGVVLSGRTAIGRGCAVGSGSVLRDTTLGEEVVVLPHSVLSGSTVGSRARIGPFAHLRPGTVLGDDVHVGNFVETKKTTMGRGSKANHLAYLGDGRIGERVNVGAGTIFCNYDGFGKWETVLEDDVFVGSDSQLVAPVRVGRGAYVGTGSTITDDVPAGALAIARARQVSKRGYAAKIRAKLAAKAGRR
jgi:bifunctional UDP-N-acetylglucosamine pyrophosphorylase/glucosamine-1-phosphate N-acetyltransferase